MKYKVGDKVMIRKDLNEGTKCISGVIYHMVKFKGKIVTISKRKTLQSYGIEEDGGKWSWDAEMFRGMRIRNWQQEVEK